MEAPVHNMVCSDKQPSGLHNFQSFTLCPLLHTELQLFTCLPLFHENCFSELKKCMTHGHITPPKAWRELKDNTEACMHLQLINQKHSRVLRPSTRNVLA